MILSDTKLDFSDVLIQPIPSSMSSRKDADVTRTFSFPNSNQTWTGVPIIASNMDTVGTFEMYRVLSKHKMITCFHKHYTISEYPIDLDRNFYMVSIGIKDSDFERLNGLVEKLNPLFVCVDVANGYIDGLAKFVTKVRSKYPNIIIMVGNVVTGVISRHLIISGADIVKVGIGSGSVCLTRRVTGCGYPQFSAIMEISKYIKPGKGITCGDGGVQYPGDLVKGFGAGAGFMMIGSMLAGHTECAGELLEDPETKQVQKVFYGMGSREAMEKHDGIMPSYRSSEGRVVKIPYKGPVETTVLHILGGIRSGMTYTNSKTLSQLEHNVIFIRVNNQLNRIYK